MGLLIRPVRKRVELVLGELGVFIDRQGGWSPQWLQADNCIPSTHLSFP